MSLESCYWKQEPCSPPLGHDSPSDWSIQEDVESSAEVEAVVPSRSALAQQLLDDIEEFVKNECEEDSFAEWFEEKVHLPIFEDIQPVPVELSTPAPTMVNSLSLPMLQTLQPLLMKPGTDVAYVLGHGHLTPPQSPPAAESPLPAPLFIIQEPSYVTLQPNQPEYITEPYMVAPPTPDLALEMAVVDEVVRGAAQQWEQWESSDTNSRSSDGTEDSDDPEWVPSDPPAKQTVRRSRQPRPYNPSDRRMRKKEQNKNAATRYRQKKKAEVTVIVEEVRGLEDHNTSLQTKLTDLQREVSYLKGLMRDVFRAKGLVK